LGSNEEQRATLDAINRVIFQRVTELVLSQSESLTRRTWIFLDEIREAGNLDSLGRLMTKGRSKGGCVVLGFQDIEGMRDAFGKERANELVGQANNKIILRLNSSETAQWASELFGKYEFIEEETGENSGGSKTTGLTMTEGESQAETKTTGNSEGTTTGESTGKSHGTSGMPGTRSEQTSWQSSEQKSRQTSESQSTQTSTNKSKAENTSDTETWTSSINRKRMEKDAVMASQFMQMPMTNPRNGLHGYYLLPSIGAFYGVLTGDFLAGTLLSPKKSEPNYLERPPSEQYLEPWSTTELTALGLTSSTTAVVTANSPEAKVQPPSVPRPLRGSEAREATKEERAKFLSHLPKGRSQ